MTKSKTAAEKAPKTNTKLDLLLAGLGQKNGSTLDELVAATGWQKHSVRGAIAGTLKKKGHVVTSEKVDGVRRYRLAKA